MHGEQARGVMVELSGERVLQRGSGGGSTRYLHVMILALQGSVLFLDHGLRASEGLVSLRLVLLRLVHAIVFHGINTVALVICNVSSREEGFSMCLKCGTISYTHVTIASWGGAHFKGYSSQLVNGCVEKIITLSNV